MGDSSPQEITQLLLAWRGGDQAALDQLLPLVHQELRRLAHRFMHQERPGHLLQTTALVNEAYLRLIDSSRVQWEIVELRFFGGLTVEETAAVLEVSPDTVMRDWQLAKVWLFRELSKDGEDGA